MRRRGLQQPPELFSFTPSIYLGAGILCLFLSVLTARSQAQAQQGPSPVQLAQTEQRRFNIPAGPLASALNRFADETGLQLVYDAALAQGQRTTGVSGSYTPEQALQLLLTGTGVTYRFTNERTVTLERLQSQQDEDRLRLDTTMVEAERSAPPTALIGNLPEPYPEGQVATGGQLGILGNRDIMDTPFNQTNYTAELMQDQQAHTIGGVLANDPSVRAQTLSASGLEDFSIRGFRVVNSDILFNGLLGVAPTFFNSMMTESLERIEVLKGPNALLNGAGPSGSVGGTINVVPKRAGGEPLLQFTPSYSMDSQLGGHLDIGRRFGTNKQFGVRFNGVYRNGDTAIDHQSLESQLVALGLDYRGEIFRLSSDLGYQYQDLEGARRFPRLNPGLDVPDPPDNRTNFNSPFEFTTTDVFYGTFRGELDIFKGVTAFAAVGGSQRRQEVVSFDHRISDPQGTLLGSDTFTFIAADKMYGLSTEAGMHAAFDTGPVQHQATVAYTRFWREWRRGRFNGFTVPDSNLYHPAFGPAPSSSIVPDPDDAPKIQDLVLSSTTLADTISLLDGRIQLTGGVRFQRIDSISYDEDKTTPAGGLIVKPWPNVSLYANYIQGLQQGATAPDGTANAGEVFPPFVTEQYEAGVKVDFGRFTSTLSAYQISQPSAFINATTNIFVEDGEQRHRGLEFNVFGEPMEGARLLGGTSYIDAELTKTAGGVNQGNDPIGVPEFQFILSAEWEVPFLTGFTLAGRIVYNTSQYLDAANTQKVPDWTQLDLGARYTFARAWRRPITIRMGVDNVFDADYWNASTFGQLILSTPRLFSAAASFDF